MADYNVNDVIEYSYDGIGFDWPWLDFIQENPFVMAVALAIVVAIINVIVFLLKAIIKNYFVKKRNDATLETINSAHVTNRNQISKYPDSIVKRDDALQKIKVGLETERRVVLSGQGGFGKSTLAKVYAYDNRDEYTLIQFIDAQSEAKLMNDYRALAKDTGLAENLLDNFTAVKKHVLQWLGTNDNYLVVFENAEGMPEIQNYLPPHPNPGHIIINTRQDEPRIAGVKPIKPGVFSEEEAVTFLKRRLKDIEIKNYAVSDEDAFALANELHFLPLALEQAGAYMVLREKTILMYLEMYRNYPIPILDADIPLTDYDKTVFTTWRISIDKIKLEGAVQLFNICAYYAPYDIPVQMLIDGRDKLPEPLRNALEPNHPEFDKIIRELGRHSLVQHSNYNEKGEFLSIHGLLQKVVMLGHGKDTSWLEYALDCVYSVFEFEYDALDVGYINAFRHNLSHAVAVAEHAVKLGDDGKEKAGYLYCVAGRGISYLGNYTQALAWSLKEKELYEEVFGLNHQETATAYHNVGFAYENLGENDQAMEWHQKALKIKEEVLGREHLSTAATYERIAIIYSRKDELNQALKWHEKVLKIRKDKLEPVHLDIGISHNNTALVYKNQGEDDKALKHYQEALKIYEKAFGLKHPEAATTYYNMAHLFHEQSKYDDALALFLKSYQIYVGFFGDSHPDAEGTMRSMKLVYPKTNPTIPFETWLAEQMATAAPL